MVDGSVQAKQTVVGTTPSWEVRNVLWVVFLLGVLALIVLGVVALVQWARSRSATT